jgi:serine/threonine protein kinase
MQDLENAAGVRAGDVLAGKYRVVRVLGAGGMGVVVMAHHLLLNQDVALKFLLPSLLSNTDVVERFAREARAAVRIKSEHVARVSDVGTLENGAPFMVMEFLEGQDLAAWLQERGPLPIDLAVDFLLQACVAVADAHAIGIVHRDLKPANLFCARRSDGQFIIKVLDFGISKITQLWDSDAGRAMTQTTSVMGSPFYMSPEQMQSSRDVDSLTDIWALGVTLYELLTGARPFGGDSYAQLAIRVATAPFAPIRALRPDAPEGLEAVVLKCLEKDKRRRFANVAELAMALEPFAPAHSRPSLDRVVGIIRVAGFPISAPPPSLATQVAPPLPPPSMGPPGRSPASFTPYPLTPPSGPTHAPTANTTPEQAAAASTRWRTIGAYAFTLFMAVFVSLSGRLITWIAGATNGATTVVRPPVVVTDVGSSAHSTSSPQATATPTGGVGPYIWDAVGGPPAVATVSGDPVERFVGRVRARPDDQFWIVAYESGKLGELWHAGPLGTYGDGYRSTFFAVTGKQVVVTDYRANVHVYDLASGRELRSAKLGERAKTMCASPESDGRVWIETSDGHKMFFDADTAAMALAARPPWCPDTWAASHDCRGWLQRGAARLGCKPASAAPKVTGFEADNVMQGGDLAVALGRKAPGTGVPIVVGFDPTTRHPRWQHPLASGDQASIAESSTTSVMDDLAGGRFVAPYHSSENGWHFAGFDALTGERQWDVVLPPVVGVEDPQGLALSPSRLYVLRTSALLVYDARTGSLVGTVGD